ncbi:unnamed protein product [Anisakis simplex]|uniref:Tyrosine-protein phosphatase domain-containing protein n=1 Tax=Anisakis simplex TaxID=6269 RepID=A0A0M3JMJ1_ANISI|nr:unnamed protein product [Anisakis simplex]
MDATINDFWRMVWQEKPKSIIMLCKLVEGGKPKCAKYFPEKHGETKQFGKVTVQNVKTTSPASETVYFLLLFLLFLSFYYYLLLFLLLCYGCFYVIYCYFYNFCYCFYYCLLFVIMLF